MTELPYLFPYRTNALFCNIKILEQKKYNTDLQWEIKSIFPYQFSLIKDHIWYFRKKLNQDFAEQWERLSRQRELKPGAEIL